MNNNYFKAAVLAVSLILWIPRMLLGGFACFAPFYIMKAGYKISFLWFFLAVPTGATIANDAMKWIFKIFDQVLFNKE